MPCVSLRRSRSCRELDCWWPGSVADGAAAALRLLREGAEAGMLLVLPCDAAAGAEAGMLLVLPCEAAAGAEASMMLVLAM